MALRQLILSKRLEEVQGKLNRNADDRAALETRRVEMQTREAEIEAALNEVTEETSEEDRRTVEAEAETFEQQAEALNGEIETNETERTSLEKQLADLRSELDELNQRTKPQAPAPVPVQTERKDEKTMNTRTAFFNMTIQERDAFFADKEVKEFLQRVRAMRAEKRAVTGAELGIPTTVLGLIRENIENYSKIKKHVTVRNVRGKGRILVSGPIPEAVWTEMCATLNELDLSFTQVELDGFKVGGVIYVCNALMEDTDIALATEIINALGQAIGLALDKAILFGQGKNKKMPMGIVTRLTQTEDPGTATAGARPWADLHESNVKSISGKTEIALFKELVKAAGNAKSKYSAGGRFWAMNEKTHSELMVNAMSINSAGAIVSGQGMTMPIIGGAIEILNFIPDNVIVGGYGDGYVLLDRADATFGSSEHYRFPEEQTAFRGSARYDGVPAIPEAFVAINIAGGTVSAGTVTFAADLANA